MDTDLTPGHTPVEATGMSTVAICDDHVLIAQGLRRLVEPPYSVVAVTHSVETLLQVIGALRPSCILLDISMPGLNGVQALPLVTAASPPSRILIVTMYSDHRELARECLRLGGHGFIPKDADRDELLQAIETVLSGLAAEAGNRILRSPARAPGPPERAYATVEVKRRLHQRRFRELVVGAYRIRCAMCRLGHDELLDAAHILPDRDERGRPEIPNGLCLCRIHHAAYDVNILGVDETYRVHVRHEVLEEHDGPMLHYGLQKMQNEELHVPRARDLKPNPDYLKIRFDQFRAA